jgi:hypothetical protein
MSTEEFYRQKADECVVAAKAATLNEERARHYALAAYYMRLAMDELNRAISVRPSRESDPLEWKQEANSPADPEVGPDQSLGSASG